MTTIYVLLGIHAVLMLVVSLCAYAAWKMEELHWFLVFVICLVLNGWTMGIVVEKWLWLS